MDAIIGYGPNGVETIALLNIREAVWAIRPKSFFAASKSHQSLSKRHKFDFNPTRTDSNLSNLLQKTLDAAAAVLGHAGEDVGIHSGGERGFEGHRVHVVEKPLGEHERRS